MNVPVAFWDSSALIPVCVSQPQTALAKALYAKYGVVAWWATQVEMISGFTRLQRMGEMTHNQFLAGKQLAREIVRDWTVVGWSAGILADACSLLELYPLRAADALQLAAALETCEQKPQGYLFVTADHRLADAARRSGFTVEFL